MKQAPNTPNTPPSKGMTAFYALASGVLFALGLVVAGMTQPAKIVAFLDLGAAFNGISWTAQQGLWDPSLAWVMGGALSVTLVAFVWAKPPRKPWAAAQFELPSQEKVDSKLIAGSALFGMGWALIGYCPGPALASLFTDGWRAPWVVAAMVAGFWLARQLAPKG